jgi:hypothetical protein
MACRRHGARGTHAKRSSPLLDDTTWKLTNPIPTISSPEGRHRLGPFFHGLLTSCNPSATLENCLVRGICGSLTRSNGGRKLDSPGRRTPDSSDSAFCVRGQLALEPRCLPGKRYTVLQESSAPRADEPAVSDTWRSRQPGSLRAMPSQFETACAI